MNLPQLEPINDRISPAFLDKASCQAWLHQLQLTNLHQAHTTLRLKLDEFNRYPIRGADRLHTLEALRETIATIQSDYAKKLIGKKLPLSNEDLATFLAVLRLWQCMSEGYQRCLQAWEAGDKHFASHEVLLVHRCLRYVVLQSYEYLRIGYEIDTKTWQQLHTLYTFAEARELHHQPVTDDLYGREKPTNARTVYCLALLGNRIANIGLTRSQWQTVDRWMNIWGDELFTLELRCTMSRGDAQPLAVDLSGTFGLQALSAVTSSATMRYMAMVPLSKSIRVKTILLQQGKTPGQLGLGSEITSTDAVAFLNLLHKHWCEESSPLLRNDTIMQVCYGLDELYAQVAGKPFEKLGRSIASDKAAIQQNEAFGRVLSDTNRHDLSKLGFVLDEWQTEEAISLLGVRLLRKDNKGERIGLNQLIGVRQLGKKDFNVGAIKSVFIDRASRMHAIVRFLPGTAQAIVIRGGPLHASAPHTSAAALLLQEIPNLRIPSSLLLPREWFQSNRHIEITLPDNRILNVMLGFSVEKGADFERVSYKLT
jgi:hypothetical protein